MPTSSEIKRAIYTQAKAFADGLGLQLSYPGQPFTPPDSGQWLELMYAPNDYDPYLSEQQDIKRGLFIINCCARVGPSAAFDMATTADAVKANWPKRTPIVSDLRTSKTPYESTMIDYPDRVKIPVTIEYEE